MANNIIQDIRGGLNDTDPPNDLEDDQLVVCENVEFDAATLGGKRVGSAAITLNATVTAATGVYHVDKYNPTNDDAATVLMAVSRLALVATLNMKAAAWTTVAFSVSNELDTTRGLYSFSSVSLHGKWFVAYPSIGNVDRLHVYDGTTLRRVGISTPVGNGLAGVADAAAAGTYAGLRYVRIRWVTQVAGVTVRRSEPSTSTSYTPLGTRIGELIQTIAAPSDGETHWELEEAIDGVNFYRIATTLVGSTYTDTTAYASVTTAGPLSADIGDYTAPYSAKFLLADEDRLLTFGAWENPLYASRVSWTPVNGDTSGVGNDERFAIDTDPFLDLDGFDGGEITAACGPLNGYIYVFKRSHIYKLIATGNRAQSYEAIKISDTKGAIPGSVFTGLDETGATVIYFADPKLGPQRIGPNGIEECGYDISTTWSTVNLNALAPAVGVWVPSKRQAWWNIATGANTTPNKRIVAHTKEMRRTDDGVRRGWSIFTGKSTKAITMCLFADNINANTTRSLSVSPVLGLLSPDDRLLLALSGTTDATETYRAYFRTRPFIIGSLVQQFGVLAANLLAAPQAGVTITVKVRRNFGLSTDKSASVLLTPVGTEDAVIKPLDNLSMAELFAMQFEIGDTAAVDSTWKLYALGMKLSPEETI